MTLLTSVRVPAHHSLAWSERSGSVSLRTNNAVRTRRRMPAFLRDRVQLEDTPDGGKESWTIGFTTDTILAVYTQSSTGTPSLIFKDVTLRWKGATSRQGIDYSWSTTIVMKRVR